MLIKAESKNIRQTARKLRLVADLVRPLKPEAALLALKHLPKRAATPLEKTLKQAMGNAVNNLNLPAESLTIARIEINEGPTYKRWQAVARGRAHKIFKRTSHIRVVLESKPKPKPVKKANKTKKVAKPNVKKPRQAGKGKGK